MVWFFYLIIFPVAWVLWWFSRKYSFAEKIVLLVALPIVLMVESLRQLFKKALAYPRYIRARRRYNRALEKGDPLDDLFRKDIAAEPHSRSDGDDSTP
ncbi:hypothetical protein [Gallaecimonas mangrovi]|uniref:hypothetical protein n=1 Tax=Gallaecimonas mangrovi TaxID=2291597 RepID=UPI000E1FC9BB|nr:hypothetical protein [Gallaecimonas mangrovi]